jgi:hypothetical protein
MRTCTSLQISSPDGILLVNVLWIFEKLLIRQRQYLHSPNRQNFTFDIIAYNVAKTMGKTQF